ncbi:MAG: helix-turn-helix transcriptional regulator [Candidatus Competibacteraceae bacterium]|nr:helix-turn-helix transcriptional regulator [Candidatus Competibacteraceae bacterium]
MSISERIQAIMDGLGLHASQFADRLSIQRSSLSHFFTGRNKPGWDFLEKLSQAFPEVNIRWLLTGKGNMFHGDAELQIQPPLPPYSSTVTELPFPEDKQAIMPHSAPQNPQRVLILYENGRFELYESTRK